MFPAQFIFASIVVSVFIADMFSIITFNSIYSEERERERESETAACCEAKNCETFDR